MHFHAEHSLFFRRRPASWRPGLSLGLVLCVLIINIAASNLIVSLSGGAAAIILLLSAWVQGHHRIEPAITWTLTLIASALLAGVFLGDEPGVFAETAARIGCGVLWVLWLGTQLDWASLRHILLKARVPEGVVHSLDYSVMGGILTQREWIRRRDAARLRLGKSRLPMRTWGQVLGEGALSSFFRLESVEEGALLRSSSILETSDDQTIRLQDVTLERGGESVLRGVNIQIEAGEWVLLCGPSGAGKSSLLRLLAGLDKPKEGTMTRLGVTVSTGANLSDRLDGRVALLTQNPEHHFIASTVAEDIAWGLHHRGIGSSEAMGRAESMANALGVDHLLERPCHALSFGEQRRVALAGLLVLEPSVLLLDEPTAGLDPVAAHGLRTLVDNWAHKTGAACVWATHDLHFIPPRAERIILLRNGEVIFDGSSDEGLSHPWLIKAGLRVPPVEENSC